jgi:hypothetical protein
MQSWLRILDVQNPGSLSVRLRLHCFHLFKQIPTTIDNQAINIVNLGETLSYWQTMKLSDLPDIKLTLHNLSLVKEQMSNG